MSATAGIEWTDATWNPVTGCTTVSPGCEHCYARTFAERFRGTPGRPPTGWPLPNLWVGLDLTSLARHRAPPHRPGGPRGW